MCVMLIVGLFIPIAKPIIGLQNERGCPINNTIQSILSVLFKSSKFYGQCLSAKSRRR